MIKRKRNILMIDVMYSNQAKALLGSKKTNRQTARNMVTGQHVRHHPCPWLRHTGYTYL